MQKTILIVDDEAAVINSLEDILKDAGYSNFLEAQDGEEALEIVQETVPDLIILDMKMPRMSGYEVIGRLKEDVDTEDIPVLIISGYKVEIEQLGDYLKKKAIPILGKPFDNAQLIKMVDYLL